MAVEIIPIAPEQDREAWLALRRDDVTASVAGALLGVHPFKTRYALWLEKAGRIEPDEEENEAMLRGRVMEAPALQLLALKRPTWRIERPNVYLRDPAIRMGATPDAYAVDPARKGFGIVQVKTTVPEVFKRKWRDEDGEIEPPLWIVAQAIQEAHLAGADWACIAVLVMGMGLDVEVIEVPIHKGIVARLRAETVAFWKSVAAGEEPAPDYNADASLLSGIYADDNGREIDLTGDNMLPALLEEREQVKARLRADGERAKAIDAEIIHKIGDFERAFLPGWLIRRPLVERRGFYVEPTEYRKLSIKRYD